MLSKAICHDKWNVEDTTVCTLQWTQQSIKVWTRHWCVLPAGKGAVRQGKAYWILTVVIISSSLDLLSLLVVRLAHLVRPENAPSGSLVHFDRNHGVHKMPTRSPHLRHIFSIINVYICMSVLVWKQLCQSALLSQPVIAGSLTSSNTVVQNRSGSVSLVVYKSESCTGLKYDRSQDRVCADLSYRRYSIQLLWQIRLCWAGAKGDVHLCLMFSLDRAET